MRCFAMEPTELRRLREWIDNPAARIGEATETHGVLYANGGKAVRDGRIAVLSLSGMMDQKDSAFLRYFGGTSTETFGRELDRAMGDESVRAVVLDIDSPGGYVTGTPELANHIYRSRGSKPIVSVANPMAASAALFAGSAADEFYVTPTGDVGSLGVRTGHLDVSKYYDEMGVVETMIVATDSPHKAEMWSGAALTDEDRERAQDTVDAHMVEFVGAMARHRGVTTEHVKERFGKGRMLMPKEAKAAGMVDGIATFDEVVGRLAKKVKGRSTKSARARLALTR